MALQIWLPLNGDIHNQGLLNLNSLTPSQNTMTFNNAGKIGKCGTGMLAWHLTEDILDNTWSVATWFKTSSSFDPYNNIIFCKNSTQSTDCQIYFSIINGTSLNIGVNGPSTSLNQSYTFAINTWYHIAATYDGTKVSLYINGVFQKSTNVTTAKPSGRLNIRINGRSTNAGNTSATGQLAGYSFNDFRLYDHALSAKEVAEIAKGLIIHYKLDSYEIESTINICSQLVKGGRTNVINNTIQNTGENADTYWYIKPKEALVGGATYTVSCNLSGFSTPDKFIQWGVGSQSGDNCAGYWRTYNGYNSFTFTMPAGKDGSTANFIFDDNGGTRTEIFTLSNIQLEKKDHATPFVGYGKQRGAQYDTKIYIEPDGSKWLHIAHHNNPSSSGYFNQTDPWTTGVYLNEDKWYDVNGVIDQISTYEFMVKQKTTSSGSEAKYRWVQNKNPLTAVYNDVKPGTVIFNTSTGYTNSTYGGLWQMNSSARLCIANATASNWYGAFGCWTAFQTNKVPGFPNAIIDTGYMDLYVRIDGTNLGKIYDCSGYSNNGTMVGSLTAVAGSPRYGVGTVFNGSNSAIKVVDNNWVSQGREEMTINLWTKSSAWGGAHFFSCTESGGFNTEAGNSGNLRFPINVYTNAEKTSHAYKYDSNEIQLSVLPINEWVMLTFVYDTTGTKTYINGQLHHTYTNTSYGIYFNTNARLFLGCEANSANPSPPYFNGQESDFRMYATALSAAAVKELYTTSLKIVSGNPVARELSEL